MKVNELTCRSHTTTPTKLSVISTTCSDFISESNGYPITKLLPVTYNDCHKVRVRTKKRIDNFAATFNAVFEHKQYNIRQRSIIVNDVTNEPVNDNTEKFYIFPINGFEYMYNANVKHSDHDYRPVFETVTSQMHRSGKEILSDLLHLTYMHTKLDEGIQMGAEIIIYRIPFYYAIRASKHTSYEQLLTQLH